MDNTKLTLIEQEGDIFDAPPNTLLVHACSCTGSWSHGIADQFKAKFPNAYNQYVSNCLHNGVKLLGSSQLITPINLINMGQNKKYFIGCLFTSEQHGRNKNSEISILENTSHALSDLLTKVSTWNKKSKDCNKISEIHMCRINSGLFDIPWERTKNIITEVDAKDINVITVVYLKQ